MKPRAAYGYGSLAAGVLAIAVAMVLPFQQSSVYDTVEDNLLIQNWSGGLLLFLDVFILITGHQTFRGRISKWWQPTASALGAMILILWMAADKERRTLYPIGASGMPDMSQPGSVSAVGIGVLVAGAGAAVAFIGCLMMHGAIAAIDDEDEYED